MSFYKVGINNTIQGGRGDNQRGSGIGRTSVERSYNNRVLKNTYNPTEESTSFHDVVKGRPYYQPGTDKKLPQNGKTAPSLRSMFPARTKFNEFDFPRSSYQTVKVMNRVDYLTNLFELGFTADSLSNAVELGDKTMDKIFGKEQTWDDEGNLFRDKDGNPVKKRPFSLQNILESGKSIGENLATINKYIKDNKGMLSATDKKDIAIGVAKSMEGVELRIKEGNTKILEEMKEFSKEIGKMDRSVFNIPDVIIKEIYQEKSGSILNLLINNAMYNNKKGKGINIDTPIYDVTLLTKGSKGSETVIGTEFKPFSIASLGASLNGTKTKQLVLSNIDMPYYIRTVDMDEMKIPLTININGVISNVGEESQNKILEHLVSEEEFLDDDDDDDDFF